MKTLEQMAKEAGFYIHLAADYSDELTRFASLVAERCAQLVTVDLCARNRRHPVDEAIAIKRAILAEFPKP